MTGIAMDLETTEEVKAQDLPQPKPVEEPPEDSIRKMAVLFTDIVASSRFFKTFGDMAGRKMLKAHEGIATPPIQEHGGVVVKMLGDSLMAYFFHPWEAVKAAIKVQQRLQVFNKGKDPREQIHIRIAVHFGEGILEADDIFGDVVNMAAKFLPFINGDEIGISRAVFDHIQGNSALRFETVGIPDKENFPQGFHLYRVNWGKSVDLEPMMKTLVLFRPLFAIGKANFRRIWEEFLKERNRVLSIEIEKQEILRDKSLALITRDPSISLTAAKEAIANLKLSLGMDGHLYLPLQVVIDIGPFLRGDKLQMEELRIQWEDIEPGGVYVSSQAYLILRSRGAFQGIPLANDDQNQPFHRIFIGEEEKRGDCLFLYQNSMIQGDLAPCFYCGDRRHTPTQCPSKRLTEPTNVISRLGYLPLERINKLFFGCLNENALHAGPHHGDGADPNTPSFWPYYSFYELRSVFQLRLFRGIWNAREEDWNRVKEGKVDTNYHGGLSWIAQDCIRVSNLEQAESILREALAKEPEDYKPLCAMGFISVEKEDFSQAKLYLKKALDRCQTNPQRILILFLLYRIFQLQGDQSRAEDAIRRILRNNPACSEALYEEVLLQFNKGKEALALHLLMKLIKRNREYYIYALIDPELSKYRELIHPKIKTLIEEARNEASKVAQKATEDTADLKRWLGDGERETKDAAALLSRIEELAKADSYFSNLDVIHYGNNLVGIGRKTLEERKKRIGRVLKELSERHEKCSTHVKAFPYRFLVASIEQTLGQLQARITRKWGIDEPGEPSKFKDVLAETDRLSEEMSEIELKLQRMAAISRLLLFLSRFLKKTILFQSANLLVAIILFPIVMYYLNLLLPGMNVASQNIWVYQKSVLSLGSISGLLLALLTSGSNSGSKQALRR